MLFFDPTTKQYYATHSTQLVITILAKGCQGNTLEITECLPPKSFVRIDTNIGENTPVFVAQPYLPLLKNGRITRTQKGWIFSAPSLKKHCRCGTSFSWKIEKNGMAERIHSFKKTLQKEAQPTTEAKEKRK